jgi:hypothetical protein
MLPLLLHTPPHASSSLDLSSLRVGTLPVTFFPCRLPGPAKQPLFRAILNSCTGLPLVHLVVMWEPSGFILSPRWASRNWGPILRFPPASYMIQNFRPTDYSPCHLLSPWRWGWYIPPKRPLSFNGLHCVISQKIVLFIWWCVPEDTRLQFQLVAFMVNLLIVDSCRSVSLWCYCTRVDFQCVPHIKFCL